MKKLYLLIFILFTLVQTGISQTAERKIAVGFSVSKNQYVGDYGGNPFLDAGHSELPMGYLSYGFSVTRYFSRKIDFSIQANYGDFGYWNTADYMKQNFKGVDAPASVIAIKYQAAASIKYKFQLVNEDDIFMPFLTLGMGIAGYDRNVAKDKPINPDTGLKTSVRFDPDGSDLIVPIGAGFNFKITDLFVLQYQFLYNLTSNDNHDTHMAGSPGNLNYDFEHRVPGNDAFGEHVISIMVTIPTPSFDHTNVWKKQGYRAYQEDNWKTFRYRKK